MKLLPNSTARQKSEGIELANSRSWTKSLKGVPAFLFNSLTVITLTAFFLSVDGGELFERVIEDQELTERDAVLYTKEIVKAVQYLHSNFILHLDLKVSKTFSLYLEKSLKLGPVKYWFWVRENVR